MGGGGGDGARGGGGVGSGWYAAAKDGMELSPS